MQVKTSENLLTQGACGPKQMAKTTSIGICTHSQTPAHTAWHALKCQCNEQALA
jgi:hypothetical protein